MNSQPHQLLSLYLLIVLMFFFNRGSHAQNINDGFQADTNGDVRSVAVQDNGQIILAGDFTRILGQPRSRLAKLNADGSLDGGFSPSVNDVIRDVVIQDDGHIIIAGDFTEVNGIARSHIARLAPNGLLDLAFFPVIDATVTKLHQQSDGKILLGGGFSQLNGVITNRIARLLPDGNIDPAFDVGQGTNGSVYSIGVQSDGKIIIGGVFTSLDDNPFNNLGRLLPNGTADLSFNQITNIDGVVTALAVLPDDTFFAGGAFSEIDNQNQAFLARFNRSGTLDHTFTPSLNNSVNDMLLKGDGKMLVAGAFSQYNGNALQSLLQLNADGQLDAAFGAQSQPSFTNGHVQTIAVQADDKILIGGTFNQSIGEERRNLARLYPNGQLDKTLNPGLFIGDYVGAIAYDNEGNSYIGGQFQWVNTEPHENIAKLTPDGFVDSSFNTNINGQVNTIVVSTLFRRLLIGGDFSSADGLSANNIMMTALNGIRDNSFNAFTDGEVTAILELPNGQYMIGGSFENVSGFARKNLAVINSDGSIEPNFTVDTNSAVNSLILQEDGRVIVGGSFDLINGFPRNGIARMFLIGNQGFIDTFDPNPQNPDGSGGTIYAMQFQPESSENFGILLVTGSFSSINSISRDGLARLIINNSTNDVLVDELNLPLNPSGVISSLAVNADGDIIVGGNFSSIDGVSRNNMARINPNGEVDLGFRADANASVTALALMPDGKIMAGGPFSEINGTNRNHLARLSQRDAAIKTFKLNHTNKINVINRWRLDWKLDGSHPQVVDPPVVTAVVGGVKLQPVQMIWNDGQWEYNFTTLASQEPLSARFFIATKISSGVFNRSQSLLQDSLNIQLIEDIIFTDGFENLSIK